MPDSQHTDVSTPLGYAPPMPAPAYPQPGYPPQPGYAQPGHAEAVHAQPGYPPQTAYPQPGYPPQPGYAQPGYAEAVHAQPGYPPQTGYPQAAYPQAGYPQPGYPAAGQPMAPGHPQAAPYGYGPPVMAGPRPSVWPVVVLTLLLGIFGLIFAYLRAGKARSMGFSERPYWQAWAITFACWLALVVVL